MNKLLIEYYRKELAYLRSLGAEYAKKYPKIAQRLRLSENESEDGNIERLIETSAFLMSRLRFDLDTENHRLGQGMQEVLSPEAMRPVPSMGAVSFSLSESILESYTIKKGTMLASMVASKNKEVYYRTGCDTTLFPVRVEQVEYLRAPFQIHLPNRNASSLLKVSLKTFDENLTFADFANKMQEVDFFLGGADKYAFRLFELLVNHLEQIFYTNDENHLVSCDQAFIEPCFIDEDSSLIPQTSKEMYTDVVFREFFAFPARFLFLKIKGLSKYLQTNQNTIDLYFVFNEEVSDLIHNVDIQSFQLGCVPVINLFEKEFEPKVLDNSLSEIKLVANSSKHEHCEIYSVDKVRGYMPGQPQVEFMPLYKPSFQDPRKEGTSFWSLYQRPSAQVDGLLSGTESFLSIMDFQGRHLLGEDLVLMVHGLCTNRDLANDLVFETGGRPHCYLLEGTDVISEIKSVAEFTTPNWPDLQGESAWALRQLFGVDSLYHNDGLATIMQKISLQDFSKGRLRETMLGKLKSMKVENSTQLLNLNGISVGVVGHKFDLIVDQEKFSGTPILIFLWLIECLLRENTACNTFLDFSVVNLKNKETWKKWPIQCGNEILT